MGIGLFADIENRAAPVLHDLDHRSLFRRLRHFYAAVGPDGNKFAFAHDDGRAIRPGLNRTASSDLRPAARRSLTILVADCHASIRFADCPCNLCVDTGAGEQEGERSGL